MRVISFVLLLSSFLLIGCEDEDLNSVAQAQACLDSIPYEATASELYDLATECQEYVSGISSEKAYVIKCSAEFIKGGVDTKRITQAMARLEDSSNSEAAFMGALAVNEGADINKLVDYCTDSGVVGLQYLSSLSYTGTKMAKIQLGVSFPKVGEDFPDGYPSDGASMITACDGNSSCENAETGEVIYNLKDSYCVGANASSSVCEKIDAAASASNVESSGNYQDFMDSLLSNM